MSQKLPNQTDQIFNKMVDEILYDNDDGYNDCHPSITETYSKKSILKSVYCNYRGYLIVYDVHGEKVQELSGKITYEKHLEIESRLDEDITEFEGIEDYVRFVKEFEESPSTFIIKPLRRNPVANPTAINNGIIASNGPPPNAIAGTIYYDISLNQYGIYDGKKWCYYQTGIPGTPVKTPPNTNRQAPPVRPLKTISDLEAFLDMIK